MQSNLLILSSLLSLVSGTAIRPRQPLNVPSLSMTPKTASIPDCISFNMSTASMPTTSPALPPPSQGLYLYHIAVGRGTQASSNYTCASQTSTPVSIGAVATLYNATCLASNYPIQFPPATGKALTVPLSELAVAPPLNLDVSGRHYFADTTTPTFNLDTSTTGQLGFTFSKKVATLPAPSTADAGAYGAVAWLKLEHKTPGSVGPIKEIYRLNTAGGGPPASCEGMGDTFEVEYAAEYWFWAGPGS
ncbi:hypothetical protein MMC06_005738 [Schaereria dolodes]|nr:hypothetical protein [Schaereria dolodes]